MEMKSVISGFFIAVMATMVTWAPALADADCPYTGESGRMWGHGMYGMHGGIGGIGGIGGPFMMILFFATLIVIAILLIKWLGGGHRHGCCSHRRHHCGHRRSDYPGKTPEDILRERFARGEVDKAEFEERRSALSS